MQIIDKQEHFDDFLDVLSKNDFFIYPIFSDRKYHSANNDISVLFVSFFEIGKDFVFLLNHADKVFELDEDELFQILNNDRKKYTFDKKQLLHQIQLDKINDVDLIIYFNEGEVPTFNKLWTPTHDFYQRMYHRINHINRIVPVLKHMEYLYKIKQIFLGVVGDYDTSEYHFYNEIVIPSLFRIEQAGLRYDVDKFKHHFMGKWSKHQANDKYLFCQFHPFTTTGRPSNNFGGINFAALQKKTGEREVFESRYDNGILVEFDFDSYHMRLIAERINYTFPEDRQIHDYFGQFYFNKEHLTDAEYNESKEISFRLLYGGIDKEFLQIPYFAQVDDLIYRLWQKFERTGFIESPISHKKIVKANLDEMNKYKLWNYFIQLIETENSLKVINDIQAKFTSDKTKLVLYTYDSFLFDTMEIERMPEIKKFLEKDGKYPVKIKYGRNYHQLKKI